MNAGTPIPENLSGHHLQGDGLSRSGGAGDEAVAVRKRGEQRELDLCVPSDQQRFGPADSPRRGAISVAEDAPA
jgi:hypothetical protein